MNATTQVVRTMRISRILKLVSGLEQLQVIFATMINSLSSLMNIGMLMSLLVYIYAVIGINLFADVKFGPPMHDWLNFRHVGYGYLTLIGIATNDSWIDLMNTLGREKNEFNDCIESPTYTDYINAG